MASSWVWKMAGRRATSHGLAMLIVGVSIGYLIGFSATPVIQGVVTTVLALVVGVAGVLAGIEVERRSDEADAPAETRGADDRSSLSRDRARGRITVTPWPIACLLLALAVGASLGVSARVGEWFGQDPTRFAKRWEGTGLPESERVRRLFDSLYPPTPAADDKGAPSSETDGKEGEHPIVSARTSALLRNLGDSSLRQQLATASEPKQIENALIRFKDPRITALIKRCPGHEICTKAAVEELLLKPNEPR